MPDLSVKVDRQDIIVSKPSSDFSVSYRREGRTLVAFMSAHVIVTTMMTTIGVGVIVTMTVVRTTSMTTTATTTRIKLL
jgi:hypothetical protein